MRFGETAELTRFRADAAAWLDANAPSKGGSGDFTGRREQPFIDGCRAWQARLNESGWAGITWPVEHGGQGRSALYEMAFRRLQARYGVSTAAFDVGIGMVGPTIMVHGTPSQRRHLPALLAGREVWCQMFSEPGAGSDLAGLSTRARPDGGGWVVTGQKVWTSYARFADYAILLARSDPDRPKHRGITCFLVDMALPGIEVRPIAQMNGSAEFNEVFLDEVRLPPSAVLGEVHDGWTVANTMLGNERGLSGDNEWPGVEDLVAAARGRDASDLRARQVVADVYIRQEILRYLDLRMQSRLERGESLGPLPSIVNLFLAEHLRRAANAAAALVGLEVLVAEPNVGPVGRWQYHLLTAPCVRIASGTDEIQRNILGERSLGLPREPRPVPAGGSGAPSP